MDIIKLLMIYLFAFIMFFLIEYLIKSIGLSLLFKKFFEEKWKFGFVPVYNEYLLYKNLNIGWNFFLNYIIYMLCLIIYKTMGENWPLYFIPLYYISMNLRIEYKLCKELGQNKVLFCILKLILPNFTYIINGLLIK